MTVPNNVTRHPSLLPEVLLAMAIGMVVAGSALQLLGTVWIETRDTYAQTTMLQETHLARKIWRNFVHACPAPLTPTVDGGLANGAASARVSPDGILLLRGPGKLRQLPMPRNMGARLKMERSKQGYQLAILVLEWHDREGDRKQPRQQRIVATNSAWGGKS